MKKSILIFNSILFLLLGSPFFSFAQDAIETEVFYAYERVNYECQIPIVKALPLPEETEKSSVTKERKSLIKGLRITTLEALPGEITDEVDGLIRNEVSSLSGKLDYRYSLPYTKIDIKLFFGESGAVERVFVDGDKLDEHLIKALEDALFEWEFTNDQLVENLMIRFELVLSPVV